MLIQYLNNSDNKTTTFLVNHLIINDEVPYVPERLVDHRGLALYLFCKEEDVDWEDLEFDGDYTENFNEIERGYLYMFDPIYVRKEVKAREQQRRIKRYN